MFKSYQKSIDRSRMETIRCKFEQAIINGLMTRAEASARIISYKEIEMEISNLRDEKAILLQMSAFSDPNETAEKLADIKAKISEKKKQQNALLKKGGV